MLNFKVEELEKFLLLIKGDRNQFSSKIFHDNILDKIKKRWKNWGVDSVILTSHFKNFEVRNLFVPPKDTMKPFILLIAHYDTVPNSPGVDDNGSGLILIDALIRTYFDGSKLGNFAFALVDHEEGDPRIWKFLNEFNQKGIKIEWADITNKEKTNEVNKLISFIYSKVEDWTSFVGTRHLIDYLEKKGIFKYVSYVVNFETCGYTSENQSTIESIPIKVSKGDFIGIIGNSESIQVINQIMDIKNDLKKIELIVEDRGLKIPDTRRSDHALFWDRSIPAIMITDTANFRNPHYHKKTDLKVDFDFLSQLINLFQILLFEHKLS